MSAPFVVHNDFESPLRLTSLSYENVGVTVLVKAVGGTFSIGQAGGSQAIIPDGGGIAIEASIGMDSFSVSLTQLNPAVPVTVAYGYKHPTTGATAYGPAQTLPGHPVGEKFTYQFALKNLTSGAIITGAAIDDVSFTEKGQ